MTENERSLVVIDDEDAICLAFERFFDHRGWKVRSASSAAEGLALCKEHNPRVVFLDVRLPDGNGLDMLADLSQLGAAVVIVTAYGGLGTAVNALHGQAADYMVKPIDLEHAFSLAKRLTETRVATTGPGSGDAATRELLLGSAPAMQNVYKIIARAAGCTSPVLIQGDTGTGKELAAMAIHRFSARSDGPFRAVNCGAIPEPLIEGELFGHVRGAFTGADRDRVGKFEAAAGGTLLLDEIGDLPLSMQVKLLRVLDTGIVEQLGSSKTVRPDVRVLAATNRDLAQELEAGRFRADLYYRLAVIQITMPPLREHRQDIPLLAARFLEQLCVETGSPAKVLGADAVDALMAYEWPGNVRELKNTVDHAATMAPDHVIRRADLPHSVTRPPSGGPNRGARLRETAVRYASALRDGGPDRYGRTISEVERALIAHAMERQGGNQSEAAEYLGIHRNTLHKKLRALGAKAREGQTGPMKGR